MTKKGFAMKNTRFAPLVLTALALSVNLQMSLTEGQSVRREVGAKRRNYRES